MKTEQLQRLADELADRLKILPRDKRLIVGIAGIPGAGKSTIAEQLVQSLNAQVSDVSPAIVVPMDGYHWSNENLQRMGLLELKGVPDSFDAAGFCALMQQIRSNTSTNIPAPLFDRNIEASIDGGIVIEPEHRICVVEGNYLLLPKSPWLDARRFFDQVWFLDVSIDTVYPRLMARHLLYRSPEEAEAKIESTDLPNARLILETRKLADKIVDVSD